MEYPPPVANGPYRVRARFLKMAGGGLFWLNAIQPSTLMRKGKKMEEKEKLKAILTGKAKVPKVIVGFVPGEKFKTPDEVEKAIEKELSETENEHA